MVTRDTRYLVSQISGSDLSFGGISIASLICGLHPLGLDPIITKIPGMGLGFQFPRCRAIAVTTELSPKKITVATGDRVYWATDSTTMEETIRKLVREEALYIAKTTT